MNEIKVRLVDGSLGVILPDEMVDRLQLKSGDKLTLSEEVDGSFKISAGEAAYQAQMDAAVEGMKLYKKTLHTLAK